MSVRLVSEVQHAQVLPAVKARHQPLPAAAMGPEQLRQPPQEGRRTEMKAEAWVVGGCWSYRLMRRGWRAAEGSASIRWSVGWVGDELVRLWLEVDWGWW